MPPHSIQKESTHPVASRLDWHIEWTEEKATYTCAIVLTSNRVTGKEARRRPMTCRSIYEAWMMTRALATLFALLLSVISALGISGR